MLWHVIRPYGNAASPKTACHDYLVSIRKHTAYNFAGSVVSLAVLLVSIPWYLQLIGMERYGVLSILWLLFGYFGFFDFGIGRAVAQRVAALSDKGDRKKIEVLWAGLLVNLVLAVLGAFFLYFALGYILTNWIDIDAGVRGEVDTAVFWVSLSLIPSIASGALSGVVLGSEKFLMLNIVDVTGKVALQILPLATALLFSPELGSVTQAIFIARVLAFFLWVFACIKLLPDSMFPRWKPGIASTLWKYGSWITLGMLLAPLLSGVERLVIGHLQGATFVTHYAIPFSLIAPIALLSASLSNALFPRFASEEKYGTRRLADNAVLAVVCLVTPIMVLAAFIVQPFLSVWIDVEFSGNTVGIAQVLIVGFWANSVAKVFHTKLQGEGKPETVAIIHLMEVLPFILTMYLMISQWGVLGAALAWTIRTVADMLLLGNKSGAWRFPQGYILFAFVLVVGAALISTLIGQDTSLLLVVGIPLVFLAVVWSWKLGLKAYVVALCSKQTDKQYL